MLPPSSEIAPASIRVCNWSFTTNTWFMYYNKKTFTEDDVKSLDTMLEKGKVSFPLTNSWYIAAFYLVNVFLL